MAVSENSKRQGYGNPALRGTINRLGRSPGTNRLKAAVEDNPTSMREMGQRELAQLYRKCRPHAKTAIQVLTAMMTKSSASEATQVKAACEILRLYTDLVDKTYIAAGDQLLDPDSVTNIEQSNQPAVIVQLRSVKPGESSGEDRKIGDLNPSDNK